MLKLPKELDELKDLQQWICHKDKVPKNPHTGGNAMANVPETWGTYDEAVSACECYKLSGIGFQIGIFPPNTLRISAIDLDHVIKENGELETWAAIIVEKLNSYTEVSPSGTGLHILLKTKVADKKHVKVVVQENQMLEMYTQRHYITVTGEVYGEARELSERSEEFDEIYKEYFVEKTVSEEKPSVSYTAPSELDIDSLVSQMPDYDLLDKARNAENGSKFIRLFDNGDSLDYGNDDSSADLGLAMMLAFWTRKDFNRMNSLMMSSMLLRKPDKRTGRSRLEKWNKVHYSDGTTYGTHTLNAAIMQCDNVYNPVTKTEFVSELGQKRDLKYTLSIISLKSYMQKKEDNDAYAIASPSLSLYSDLVKFRKYINRKTGYNNVDSKISLYPGLYVLGAISSLGKTTFIHQMADQLAESGSHVLYFSLEQTLLEMTTKGLSRLTAKADIRNAVSAVDIRKGVRTAAVIEAEEKYASFSENEYIIECGLDTTIETIIATVKEYIKNTENSPVVIVDYLQIIQPSDNHQTTKDAVDGHVRAFKKLQAENDLVVILISSLNRQNYLMPVDFESFKESGGIEYTADVIWGLQLSVMNDEIFEKDTRLKARREAIIKAKSATPREIDLVCLKNRYGISNYTCKFRYYAQYDYFFPIRSDT